MCHQSHEEPAAAEAIMLYSTTLIFWAISGQRRLRAENSLFFRRSGNSISLFLFNLLMKMSQQILENASYLSVKTTKEPDSAGKQGRTGKIRRRRRPASRRPLCLRAPARTREKTAMEPRSQWAAQDFRAFLADYRRA